MQPLRFCTSHRSPNRNEYGFERPNMPRSFANYLFVTVMAGNGSGELYAASLSL